MGSGSGEEFVRKGHCGLVCALIPTTCQVRRVTWGQDPMRNWLGGNAVVWSAL